MPGFDPQFYRMTLTEIVKGFVYLDRFENNCFWYTRKLGLVQKHKTIKDRRSQ